MYIMYHVYLSELERQILETNAVMSNPQAMARGDCDFHGRISLGRLQTNTGRSRVKQLLAGLSPVTQERTLSRYIQYIFMYIHIYIYIYMVYIYIYGVYIYMVYIYGIYIYGIYIYMVYIYMVYIYIWYIYMVYTSPICKIHPPYV